MKNKGMLAYHGLPYKSVVVCVRTGKVFRPAGFRLPVVGEHYIAPDGAVKRAKIGFSQAERTILKEMVVPQPTAEVAQ